MEQVLVDMDGVLADVYAHLIEYEYRETGVTLSKDNIQGLLEGEAFPSFEKVVRYEGFFRTAPRIEASVEGLNYLNNKYKVLIVSSATEFPQSLNEKQAWLQEYYPFISWKQMIFCGSKDSICGDIMIDDHIKNLKNFNGRRILFTQPHNVFLQDECLERIYTWKDIMGLL